MRLLGLWLARPVGAAALACVASSVGCALVGDYDFDGYEPRPNSMPTAGSGGDAGMSTGGSSGRLDAAVGDTSLGGTGGASGGGMGGRGGTSGSDAAADTSHGGFAGDSGVEAGPGGKGGAAGDASVDDARGGSAGGATDGGDATVPWCGDAGTPVNGGVATVGSACSIGKSTACGGHIQSEVLRCDPALCIWVSKDTCGGQQLCNSSNAQCEGVVEACVGRLPGDIVCDGATRLVCGPDLVTSQSVQCKSPQHCQAGTGPACAPCIDGEHACSGEELLVCAADHQGFAHKEDCPPFTKCNESARACTSNLCVPGQHKCEGDLLQECNGAQDGFVDDTTCGPGLCDATGKHCDLCLPNTASCKDTHTAQTCSSDGQQWVPQTCVSSTPHCVGAGNCVQCAEFTDCPSGSNECEIAACTGWTCGMSYVPDNTPTNAQTAHDCQKQVCNGAGNTKLVVDTNDIPSDDGKLCTDEVCSGSTQQHPQSAPGKSCGTALSCDSAGLCDVETIATGQDQPWGIALDATNVYWTVQAGGATTLGKVMKAAKQPGAAASEVATGLTDPRGISQDADSVYWVTSGDGSSKGNGAIYKASKTTGVVTKLVSTEEFPWDIALDTDSVYWTNHTSEGMVRKVAKSGGTPQTLYTANAGSYPLAIAVDASFVFVSTDYGETVVRIPVSGGAATVLATEAGVGDTNALAIDATSVYYFLHKGSIAKIRKVPKAGGEAVDIASRDDGMGGLAIDGTHLYFGDDWTGLVQRLSTSGGTPTNLTANEDGPHGVAVDATHVYWTNLNSAGKIRRMPK